MTISPISLAPRHKLNAIEQRLISAQRDSLVDFNTTGTTDKYVRLREQGLNPLDSLFQMSDQNPKRALFIGSQGVSFLAAAQVTNTLQNLGLEKAAKSFASFFNNRLIVHNKVVKDFLAMSEEEKYITTSEDMAKAAEEMHKNQDPSSGY